MKKTKTRPKKKSFESLYFIILMLVVIIPNLLFRPAVDRQLEIRMLALSVFLGALILPMIFKRQQGLLKHSEIIILKNPAIIIYAIFIFIVGISAFWATNKSEAVYEFLKRASFFILFLYLILFVAPKKNSRIFLIKSFVILSLIISITGIFQIFMLLSESKYSLEFLYLIKGNFAQKNIFSEVLFITFAFCVYGISLFEKLWKKASIAGALLSLSLIGFLVTRAIWAGFFVSLCTSLMLYFLYSGKRQIPHRLKLVLRSFLIILGVVFLVVAIITVTDRNKTVAKHLINTTNVKEGNSFHRLNLWKKSLHLSQKHPLLGVGAGNWRIEILQYDLQLENEKGLIMPDRAHNDFLQVLVENGIVGLIPFVLLFAFIILFCIRILKKTSQFQDSFFILILFFALVGYIVDSFFNFPRERIELQIFLNIIFAFIVFEYNKSFKKDKGEKSQFRIWPFAVILLGILIISSYSAYKRLKSEVGVKRLFTYIDLKNDDQIIKTVNDIYSSFSTLTPYGDPVMEIRAVSLFQTKKDSILIKQAFDQSLKDSPHYFKTYNDLAGFCLYYKNYSKAMEYSNIALKYSPDNKKSKIIKSGILLTTNKIDEAFEILKTISPSYKNKEFQDAIFYILYKKVMNILSQSKNSYLNSQILVNAKKPNYLYKIYSLSVNRKEEFEKTFLNSILALSIKEKLYNDESFKQLQIKYHLIK